MQQPKEYKDKTTCSKQDTDMGLSRWLIYSSETSCINYMSNCCCVQAKGQILLQSFSRSQFNGSGASGSSSFSFGDSLRPPKDTNMVILDDDGLILVQSSSTVYAPSSCLNHSSA